MPRVVLDTNIIVSALTFSGLPRRVLDLCRKGEIDLVISPFILTETQTTLEQDFHWNHESAEEATTSLAQIATVVNPPETVDVIKRKKSDNRILECGLAGNVQYIVTGDKRDILPLKTFRGISIVDPRDFLECLGYLP